MNQQEYEDTQGFLESKVELARREVIFAEGQRAQAFVLARRRKALAEAQHEYDQFMEEAR